MQEKKAFDIIVIGSGIGALTAAALLAKVNKKRVLILEQHSQIGGYSHVFSRKGYTWDVGFHYIGNIFKGKLAGILMQFITGGKLVWHKKTEPFESFMYPDFTFKMHGDEKKFGNDLLSLFPDEKSAIHSYFRDCRKVSFWFVTYFLSRFLPGVFKMPLVLIGKLFERLAMMTTEDYMKRFKSEKLRAILTSQCGDYGLPPSQSVFMIHGLIVKHFMNGGYYPEGGSGEIAKHILPEIINNGGNALVNSKVTSIIIENGSAVGVNVETKVKGAIVTRQFHAPVIVSCAGAYNTFTKLVPDKCRLPFTQKCREINKPSVCVALYLGLKGDIKQLGITGANCWIYDSLNHETSGRNSLLLDGKPSSCFVSFALSNETTNRVTTATIIALTNYESFEKWKKQKSGNRDIEYYKLKETISKGLIEFVDSHCPSFSSLIDFYELGTPLSAEDFIVSPEGAMYGLPATSERYRQSWLSVKTPIDGLYLTGSDITSLGIVPSMMSGLATAAHLNGPLGLIKLVIHMRRKCRSLPPQKVIIGAD